MYEMSMDCTIYSLYVHINNKNLYDTYVWLKKIIIKVYKIIL